MDEKHSPPDERSRLIQRPPPLRLDYNSDSGVHYGHRTREIPSNVHADYGTRLTETYNDSSDDEPAFTPLTSLTFINTSNAQKTNNRRTRMRNMKKFRHGPATTLESVGVLHVRFIGALQTLEVAPTSRKRHKMYMGVIHSSCVSEEREDDLMSEETLAIERKDVFYFATGCTVFWGLTRAEEQAHIKALQAFSVGTVKQVEVEDMEFCYGDAKLQMT
ncbi:hypothetical protein Ae201684P_000777 [Aphanomyces euteiches]|nr:hypothetical protein Ae201684P_000777 [Aphanomyces euteiches]